MTKNIWAFFLCSILVFITQFVILQPVLQFGLFNTTEDWRSIFLYNTLDLNLIDKLIYVWLTFGLHTSAQLFHIGILSGILGFNYSDYQVVNVALKAIGTLSFFPLILILFKNIRLAFLATLFFGMSSATAGSFLWVVKGSEYIGIAFLNIFLITYYFVILKSSKRLLLLSSLLFLLAYLMAPPRMFPQLLLIPLVEIYWLLKTKKLKNLTASIIRTLVYILPVILVSLPAPVSSCCPFSSRPLTLLKDIINGNWQNFLDPFAGIGWTIFTNDYLEFFGKFKFNTFQNFGAYLNFLFSGPFFIFGILTFFLCPFLSKKPLKFFIFVFGLNFTLDIVVFLLANRYYGIFQELVTSDTHGHFLYTKYPTLAGIYILTVAFAAFREWKKDTGNQLYRAMWVGPIFSIVFLWPQWVIMGSLINDWMSVHWYFGIPAMGTTLMLAAIVILIYDKFRYGKLSRIFVLPVILGIIFIFYQTHKEAIAKQYLGINSVRVSLKDQQRLHDKLIERLGDNAKEGDILLYLEIADDVLNLRRSKKFYEEGLVVREMYYWMHFRRGQTLGCINAVNDRKALESSLVERYGRIGFDYRGICIEASNRDGVMLLDKESNFYKLDDFYALRLRNGEFIDIKDEILKDLGI